jgi:two-component system response regulator AlgR
MMDIVICDDEPLARQRLRQLLANFPEYKIVGEASTGRQALAIVEETVPDILLIDIEMPQGNGLETVRQLQLKPNAPAVIFITAFDQFALEAFQVQAENYLLKPIRQEQLGQALNKCQRVNKAQQNQLNTTSAQDITVKHLSIHTHRGIKLIPLSHIRFFKADQKYVVINTIQNEAVTEQALKTLEEQLNDHFLRIHRNSIVNLNHVAALRLHQGHYHITIKDCTMTLLVSRRHVQELKQKLQQMT